MKFVSGALVMMAVVVCVVVLCVMADGEVKQTQHEVVEVMWRVNGTRVEVEVSQGRLTGRKEEMEDKRIFYSFRGIPYAEPPVGDLVFQVPVAAGGWDGVRDASEDPQPCLQPYIHADSTNEANITTGTLDCLYLNVFTPHQPVHPGLPVMVFIHGGSFTRGNIMDYDPSPLLQKNVIVVTLQYRLGIYGFLSTEDNVLPGNLGLKDQTMALRWVQDNINKFGGDYRRVTIFGASAGALAVHLHILSPHSQGLFQRAILQSGTALCPWAYAENHRELAFKLGGLVNCSSINSSELLNCISHVPYPDILKALPKMKEWFYYPSLSMARVDGDFLPDNPARLLKTGRFNKVDMISGFTNDEGAYSVLSLLSRGRKHFEEMRNNVSYVGAIALLLNQEEFPQYLTQRVMLQYLQHLNITEDDAFLLTQLLGDRMFKMGHEDSTLHHASQGQKVYQYNLEYAGQHSFTDIFNITKDYNYVCHGDELLYLFDRLLPHAHLTHPEDLFVRHIMVNLWTNFAAYGNPTINGTLGFRWTPTRTVGDTQDQTTLSISTTPQMGPSSVLSLDFWRNLPTKNNKILFQDRFLEE